MEFTWQRLVLIGTGAGKRIILGSGQDLGTSGLRTALRTGCIPARFWLANNAQVLQDVTQPLNQPSIANHGSQ